MSEVLQAFNESMIEMNYKSRMALMYLNEAEEVQISDKLISKLYQTMLGKYSYIDFGEIPNSKGDITKLPHYDTLKDSIQMLEELKTKAGLVQLPELVTINTALQHIEHFKTKFVLGFAQEVKMIEVLYNTMTASLIASINLMIYTMVDFIKTPGGDFVTALDIQKKSRNMDFLLLRNLENFNENVRKGEITKFFDAMLNAEKFIGATVATSAMVVGVLIAVTPVIRELIYYMYHMRMNVSEYLEMQAKFLELNASALRYNDDKKTNHKKRTVVGNQERVAKKMREFAQKFRIKSDTSEKQTQKDVKEKIDFNDLQSSMNDMDTGSNGFSLA